LNPKQICLKLGFYKYHGAGNDFIIIDNRESSFLPDPKIIAWLCHRRFGIGGDGLILLNKAKGYDFGMQYYNADGMESTMCGNGGRCIVAFADFLSLIKSQCIFSGVDGEHTGKIIAREGNCSHVMLSMKDVVDFQQLQGDFILDTGSPHLVRFAGDVMKIDVVAEGRNIRNHATFQPGGINVNFAQQEGEGLFVRTYERGVEDETLSCGTGVTASALAFSHISNKNEGVIPVRTRGGKLNVHLKKNGHGFSGIFLEGPAIQVFNGVIDLNDFNCSPNNPSF